MMDQATFLKSKRLLQIDEYCINEFINKPLPISTGFKTYDSILGGGYTQGMHLIAAKPAHGKSTLALNIAYNMAKRGQYAIYFTLEMPKNECIKRLGILHSYLLNPREALTLKDLYKFSSDIKHEQDQPGSSNEYIFNSKINTSKAYEVLSSLERSVGNSFSVQDDKRTIKAITDEVKQFKDHGITPVIFIDYMQMLEFDSNDLRIGNKNSVDQLCDLCKRYGVVAVCISSIARSKYSAFDKGMVIEKAEAPVDIGTESNNYEYSAITQKVLAAEIAGEQANGLPADMAAWRDYENKPMLLIVSKNRNGATGAVSQNGTNLIKARFENFAFYEGR